MERKYWRYKLGETGDIVKRFAQYGTSGHGSTPVWKTGIQDMVSSFATERERAHQAWVLEKMWHAKIREIAPCDWTFEDEDSSGTEMVNIPINDLCEAERTRTTNELTTVCKQAWETTRADYEDLKAQCATLTSS